MEYSIKVNETKNRNSSVRGFAQVVFGDSFKVTNIVILENSDTGKLFVSMPRYRSNERDEHGNAIYRDVCNPITAEFRQELYGNILSAFEAVRQKNADQFMNPEEDGRSRRTETQQGVSRDGNRDGSRYDSRDGSSGNGQRTDTRRSTTPSFTVSVTPYEREGSNIRGLARIYFDDCFIINNVSLLQGRDRVFVAMPAYKTKRTGDDGRPVYQDVCYPVTKDFRERLYAEIEEEYEKAKQKSSGGKQQPEKQQKQEQDRSTAPFR